MPRVPWDWKPRLTEIDYATRRLPDRTYVSRTFDLDLRASQDHGQPARFVTKVFDEQPRDQHSIDAEVEWTEAVIYETPAGRKQVKVQVAREAGNVREIAIQRVPTNPDATRMENILTLDRDAAGRLIEFVRTLDYIPVDGTEQTVRFDDDLLRQVFSDPENVLAAYQRDPDQFRRAIIEDPSASDVIALAHRRTVVDKFRRLLADHDYFESESSDGGPESVWQKFLEANPWVLGVGLTGQLLTPYDNNRLEQWVAGFSIAGAGKRTDGLLRTTGSVRSMVFAEIKHHRTSLLATKPYRPDCWAPSNELAGGVIQVQQTVELATQRIGESLSDLDEGGAETGESTYLVRPRSFLLLGHLDQLRGPGGGVHRAKLRSFELYRRNLYEPEILTFDELLARAEWQIDLAEREHAR